MAVLMDFVLAKVKIYSVLFIKVITCMLVYEKEIYIPPLGKVKLFFVEVVIRGWLGQAETYTKIP